MYKFAGVFQHIIDAFYDVSFLNMILSHEGISLFFIFALIPVTRWMPSSKRLSKSLGENIPYLQRVFRIVL